jgi:alkylation response protein AidB-like acyl-CoA dehydrogenase
MSTITLGNPSTTDWQQTARDIGEALRPGVVERDRSGDISTDAFERLRHEGVTSALVPPEFGGGGASHTEMGQILRELGRHDPSTAVTLSMHAHLVAAQVWRHHHGMDAEKVFRKVVDDRAILVSTGASDWVGSNGSARKVDGGFRVSARKGPASGCEVGHVLVTSVRWEDAPDGPQVLHCSLPMSADGVSIEPTWDTLGLRATGSHTVVLDDVFVPDAAISLTRPAGLWHPVWNIVLGSAMPLIMAAYLGIADAAVESARNAVVGRSEPHVFQLLGEMTNAHTIATDLVAAMFLDSNDLHFPNTDEHASRTLSRKTVAADAMIETVRLALETTGGSGYTRSSDIERLCRDIHGCLFHPLPRAKQTQFTGRVALGLSPVA